MAEEDFLDETSSTIDIAAPEIDKSGATPISSGRVLLEAQIKALQNSLSRRSQMPFDPTMMALATGFLAPTKTGSFGESLGMAGANALEAAEKERARKSELEKMQLELATKQYQLQQRETATDILSKVAKGEKIGTETGQTIGGTPASSVATATGTSLMPADQAVSMIKSDPSVLDSITITDEIMAALIATGDKEMVSMAKDIRQGQLSKAGLRIKEKEVAQKEHDSVVRRDPFDPSNKEGIQIPRSKVAEFDRIAASGDVASMRKFLASSGIPGYFGKVFTETQFKQPPTQADIEAESEAKKDLRKNQMKERTDFEQVLNDAAGNANESIERSKMAKGLATDPKTKGAFGIIASKPGMQGAVLMFLKDPIHFGEVHVGISNIEDLIRQGGGSQQEIEAAQALDNIMMPIQLAYRRNLMKGTGPVSDMETAMTNKMNAQLSDTPKIIQFKSDMIIARGEYDKLVGSVYQEWADKNPTGTIGQFRQSEEFKNASNAYMGKMRQINNAYFPKSQMKEPTKTTGSGGLYNQLKQDKSKGE